MNKQSRDFLFELLETASPTGYEQSIQRLIHDRFKDVVSHIEPDVLGNLTLAINPEAKRRIMLVSHCDQIGFLVKYISKDGYLYLDSLGGTDTGVILGEHLCIHTKSGNLEGVVGRKPVHLQSGGEIQQIPPKDKVWVDIGASSEEQACKLVEVGDFVTFRQRIVELQDDKIAAVSMDNKAGLFVCLEALRRCAQSGCEAGLYVVSSVQEEIGSRGASTAAFRIRPDVGLTVDTVPATDDPGYDLPVQSHVECRLGGGPSVALGPNSNPVVGKLLRDAAAARSIPCQTDPSGKPLPNDAQSVQIAGPGVACGSVGIPQRNMHTQVEIVSLADLEYAVELLVEFVHQFKDDVDLRPFYFTGDNCDENPHAT